MEKSLYELVNENADEIESQNQTSKWLKNMKIYEQRNAFIVICIVEALIIGYLATH